MANEITDAIRAWADSKGIKTPGGHYDPHHLLDGIALAVRCRALNDAAAAAEAYPGKDRPNSLREVSATARGIARRIRKLVSPT